MSFIRVGYDIYRVDDISYVSELQGEISGYRIGFKNGHELVKHFTHSWDARGTISQIAGGLIPDGKAVS